MLEAHLLLGKLTGGAKYDAFDGTLDKSFGYDMS